MKKLTDLPNFESDRRGARKAALLRYGIASLVALILAAAVANYRGLFESGISLSDAMKHASDGFFVSGILFFGLGTLVWVSSTGFFDMLSYGFKSVWYLFTPATKPQGSGGFYEYKIMKMERRKEQKTARYIPIIGLAEIAVSVILTVIWYKIQ